MNKTINKIITGVALVAVLSCGYAIGSHDGAIQEAHARNYSLGVEQGRKAAKAWSDEHTAPVIEAGHTDAYAEGFRTGFAKEVHALAFPSQTEK